MRPPAALALLLTLVGLLAGSLWFASTRADDPVGGAGVAEPVEPGQDPASEPDGGGAGLDPGALLGGAPGSGERAGTRGAGPEGHGSATSGPGAGPAVTIGRGTVRLETVDSLRKDRAPLPGIGFRITAGPDPLGPVLATGVTDEEGGAWVDVPDTLRGEDGRPTCHAWVDHPGLQRVEGRALAPKGLRLDWGWLLVGVEGVTVEGRLVDGRGEPVEGGVEPHEWRVYSEVRKLVRTFDLDVDDLPNGRFQVHLEAPWAGVLQAESARGTGILEATLDPADPPAELRIVVRGDGMVRGRVVDPAGEPLAGVPVLVLLAELDDERGSFVLPEPRASELRGEARGVLWRTTTTGEDGRFEATGLRGGPHVVRSRREAFGGYPLLLTPEPLTPNGVEVDLVLRREGVLVRLVDARDAPVEGVEVQGDAPWQHQGVEWPATPVVALRLIHGDALGAPVDDRPLPGRPAGPGQVHFPVEQPGTYLVEVHGGPFAPAGRVVHFDGGEEVVELRAAGTDALVELVVRVRHGGRPLEALGRGEGVLRVQLLDRETGAPLLTERYLKEITPCTFRVPPGDYRVLAEGQAYVDTHHGRVMDVRGFGQASTEVRVPAVGPVEVELELPGVAHLEVTVRVDGHAAEEATEESTEGGIGSLWLDDAESVRLTLERPHRPAIPVERIFELNAGTSIDGKHLDARWPIGVRERSVPLPAGRYTLVARHDGRETRREVTLVAGETRTLELEL